MLPHRPLPEVCLQLPHLLRQPQDLGLLLVGNLGLPPLGQLLLLSTASFRPYLIEACREMDLVMPNQWLRRLRSEAVTTLAGPCVGR